MTRYRGSKGSVTIAAGVMTQVTSWEATPQRPFIDGTVMGIDAQEGDLDIPKMSGRITVKTDHGDAAQAALMNALLSNADTAAMATELLMATGKKFTLSILPTSAAVSARVGQHIETSFEFESSGAIAIAWA